MREIFYVLLGYLSGSILFARIVPQMLCHVDVTRAGEDRNPGTFNAFVAAGPLVGTVVLLLELGKGFLPVHLALNHLQPEDPAFSLILLAPVIGHGDVPVSETGASAGGPVSPVLPGAGGSAESVPFRADVPVFCCRLPADGHVSGVAAGLSGDLRGRLLAPYPDGREETADIYFSAGV